MYGIRHDSITQGSGRARGRLRPARMPAGDAYLAAGASHALGRSGPPLGAFAFVHHANQFLLTHGYPDREGVDDLVGSRSSETGYLKVLELHRSYRIPLNLHVSGTLLEAILWYRPDFVEAVRMLVQEGLVELVGSAYGQNVMRFFGEEYNARQLAEQLALYRSHFGVDPAEVRVFLPPERVWDTAKLAPVLTDPSLPNGGYRYVLLDDRLLYPVGEGPVRRREFDMLKTDLKEDLGRVENAVKDFKTENKTRLDRIEQKVDRL